MNINQTDASKILDVSRPNIYAMQNRDELPKPITALAILQYLDNKEKKIQEMKKRLNEHMARELA